MADKFARKSKVIVASQKLIFYTHLQRHQQRHRLHRVVSSVHIISHEQVVSIRRFSSYLKQLHHVVELTMDIAAHGHWTLYLLYIRLFCQNIFCLETKRKFISTSMHCSLLRFTVFLNLLIIILLPAIYL